MISIIIPVYNLEKYIKKSVESIIKEDIECEIIIINDGSKDNSGRICEEISKQNANVKVVHKENEGVSASRNLGVTIAKGEYIVFLDGDDTISAGGLKKVESLVKENKETDLFIMEYNEQYINNIQKKEEIFKEDRKLTGGIEAIEEILKEKKELPRSVWRCVFKRKLIIKNGIKFNEKYSCAEDTDFVLKCITKSKNIYYSKKALVNYMIRREDSITSKITYKNLISELEVFSQYYKLLKKGKREKAYKYFANNYANGVYKIYAIRNKQEKTNILENIKENRDILKDTQGNKYIVSRIIWKLFGYYRGSKILHEINKIIKQGDYNVTK